MKASLRSVIAIACCCGTLYAWGDYFPLVEGELIITFQPTGTAGSSGTWQPVILSPDGEYIEGPVVSYDTTDPVQMSVHCGAEDYCELGSYGIELKNNITDSVDASVVSSIVVTPNCPTVPFDRITYKNIPSSSDGENVLLSYILPGMTEE